MASTPRGVSEKKTFHELDLLRPRYSLFFWCSKGTSTLRCTPLAQSRKRDIFYFIFFGSGYVERERHEEKWRWGFREKCGRQKKTSVRAPAAKDNGRVIECPFLLFQRVRSWNSRSPPPPPPPPLPPPADRISGRF